MNLNNDKELVSFILEKWINAKASTSSRKEEALKNCRPDNIGNYIIGKSGNGNDVLSVEVLKPKSEYSISLKEIFI